MMTANNIKSLIPVILLADCQVGQVGQAALLPLLPPRMSRLVLIVVALDEGPATDSEVGVVQRFKDLKVQL
jgi:hypothetical protein